MTQLQQVPVQHFHVVPPGHEPSVVTGVKVGENLTALVIQGVDMNQAPPRVSQYTAVIDKAWVTAVHDA